MNYICNGLSEAMKRDPNMKAIPYALSESEFINLVHNGHFKSIIGHEQLAACLSRLCGKRIPYNRKNIQVTYDDVLLLISLRGRLPEHPSYVEYKDRLNFTFVRFEKQTQIDMENSVNKINEILGEAI